MTSGAWSPCNAQAEQPAPVLAPRQRRLAKIKRQHISRKLERRHEHGLLQQQQQQQQRQQDEQAVLPLPPPHAQGGLLLECPHFAVCSGCTLDFDLALPPLLGQARTFFEDECGLSGGFQLQAGGAHGWRQRARLAVRRGSAGRAVIGLFEEGSHHTVAISSCMVHHPAINEVVQLLQDALEACRVDPYDEGSRSGQLCYVQLTVVQPEDEGAVPTSTPSPAQSSSNNTAAAEVAVQLVLVWNSEARAEIGSSSCSLANLADHMWRVGQQQRAGRTPLLHSVWANFQPAPTNAILGPDWRLLHGAELAWAHLAGTDICFGPGAFMQANFGAMSRCLAAMWQHVPLGSAIVDLHAGVGTIGLSLAATRQPRSVRFVEINSQGLLPFQHSVARLRQQHEAAARLTCDGSSASGDGAGRQPPCSSIPELDYYVATAGSDPHRWCRGADVVVCDPPRKGLEPALLRWLCTTTTMDEDGPGVGRVLYLSCGFPALQRDAAALLGSGRWHLRHAEGFLFFPGTDHIETLAVFDAVQ